MSFDHLDVRSHYQEIMPGDQRNVIGWDLKKTT